ncbi:AMP-binding protein [Demequina capsici]|uniref:AMP-binding protein n=1 Tax=Demequina capsici TaxID=3075620 RepID=A0AA96JAI2_9MICO|nr:MULTISPECIES: AMP-binding protein [unclassified Demequina]WNM24184.1 AMP-binding protein [Demequina sp. OYTSA14]WNM27013.1 AMP-binding protein [Demequina sp. PMTSA13]
MNYAPLAPGPDRAVAAALSGAAAGIGAPTSGSTASPRQVLVSGAAMRAAAQATDRRLGGPGDWLLAMPADRIAGAMVLARALLSGSHVERMPQGSFSPERFARSVDALVSAGGADGTALGRRYVSLVPTQLGRLLDSPVGRTALQAFDAVLIGGAALHRDDAPANIVTTYGMTETSGGCVYDGVPLDVARVAIDADGRVLLKGPMLADGYASASGQPERDPDDWPVIDGETWHRTRDLGVMDDGRLRLLGRADDVIISGGVNVHPLRVERALTAMPAIAEAVVVGVSDAEWGERVGAVVTVDPDATPPVLDDVRSALTTVLTRAELPRQLLVVHALPRLDSGKIDRRQARRLLESPNGDA